MSKPKNYLASGTNTPIPIPDHYPEFAVSGKGPYIYAKMVDAFCKNYDADQRIEEIIKLKNQITQMT